MRMALPNPWSCGDSWDDAISPLRFALRALTHDGVRMNPFARPLPCPVADARHTAKILRIF